MSRQEWSIDLSYHLNIYLGVMVSTLLKASYSKVGPNLWDSIDSRPCTHKEMKPYYINTTRTPSDKSKYLRKYDHSAGI